MRDDWEPKTYTASEAVNRLRGAWREHRAGEAPINEVNIILGESGSSSADWDDGTITVAEELEGKREYGGFENQVMPKMEAAFESTIKSEVENQRDVLRRRFDFLNNFDLIYNGVQVADKGGGAHHGRKVPKFLDNLAKSDSPDEDHIVVDYSYMPYIDPLNDILEDRAKRMIRHEAVHALEKAVNPDFSDLWSRTGTFDIDRSSTEGLARYEEYKGTGIGRRAEQIIEDPVKIPDFWKTRVADDNFEPSNPYDYGEFAAYFLEEAFRNQILGQIDENSSLPFDQTDEELVDDYAEKRVRKTLLNNIWKQDLDSVLRDAAEFVGFPFFGNLVEDEYDQMSAYLDGVDRYEKQMAVSEGDPSVVKVVEEEDAVNKSLEDINSCIKQNDYNKGDYLRAEARLMAAERLDFDSDFYRELENTLETAV